MTQHHIDHRHYSQPFNQLRADHMARVFIAANLILLAIILLMYLFS